MKSGSQEKQNSMIGSQNDMQKCMIKFAPPQNPRQSTDMKTSDQTKKTTKSKTRRTASAAAKILASPNTGARAKSVAASVLTQRRSQGDQAKKTARSGTLRTALGAAKILSSPSTGTGAERAAASILTQRKSQGGFDVRSFCQTFRLVRPDLTRMTGYSLRSVDKWAAGENPGAATQRRLREVGRLFDGLSEIMEPEYVGQWLKTPNDAFDGSTPLQVIERGETDRIWRMIFIVETGEPI
jgi:hypothetical protein